MKVYRPKSIGRGVIDSTFFCQSVLSKAKQGCYMYCLRVVMFIHDFSIICMPEPFSEGEILY